MIDKRTYSLEWITDLRSTLGRRIDPKLIEKVIYALTLLEQLQLQGLNFIFKGGTALLLSASVPKRFSIDIDVITEDNSSKIEDILDKITETKSFLRWVDDNERKHTVDAPIGHYKLYYQSVVDGRVEPILLDILYAQNPYSQIRKLSVRHNLLVSTGSDVWVEVPTFDALLGDKLTAFAPNTTGILYEKNRPVEIIKQLFDIAYLFDNVADLNVVKETFARVAKVEIEYRNLFISTNEVLDDTFNTCLLIASRDINSAEFKHLQLGLNNFVNFTIKRFSIDEAVTASAKTAYLTRLLKADQIHAVERFKSPMEIKDWIIENQVFSRLNKLKKTNPEAFYYWFKCFSV